MRQKARSKFDRDLFSLRKHPEIYLFKIYINIFENIQIIQILILSHKLYSLGISYLQKLKIGIYNFIYKN